MPPVVIAAGVAAAGTIGAGMMASSAQKKASKAAAGTQNRATDAQLQLGRESLGLNKQIYNSNYDLLSPMVSRGNVAGESINALLGLPQAPAMTSPLATPAGTSAPGGSTPGGIPATGTPQIGGNMPAGLRAWLGLNMQEMASNDPVAPPVVTPPATPTTGTGTPTTTPAAITPITAATAMENFANSAGMQFQLDQGYNAINHGYAGRGSLESGAAMQAISDYGQQTALNNYFMPYMALLGGQQSVGAGAASSVAGVGQNFGNTAAGINSNMGSSIQQGATNIGNLQLANGQNTANMWNNIGSSIGSIAGAWGGGG